MISGYAFFLAGIAIVLVPGGGSAVVALAFLTTIALASLGYVIWLRTKNPYKNVRMFVGDQAPRESTLFAASVLALTLCVRLFRQTASMWAVAMLPIALVLMLVLDAPHRKVPYRAHSTRTLWYGAMTNFLHVFTLFYFTSVGESDELGIVYFVIGAGAAAGTLVAPLIKRKIAPKHYEVLCIMGAVIASCGLLVPQLYVATTALTSMLVTMGNAESFVIYLNDERIAPEERRLVRSKFYGIGSIVEQVQMAAAIFVCSVMIRGDASAAMAGYAIRDTSTLNLPVYRQALAICVALNALAGICVARRQHEASGQR